VELSTEKQESDVVNEVALSTPLKRVAESSEPVTRPGSGSTATASASAETGVGSEIPLRQLFSDESFQPLAEAPGAVAVPDEKKISLAEIVEEPAIVLQQTDAANDAALGTLATHDGLQGYTDLLPKGISGQSFGGQEQSRSYQFISASGEDEDEPTPSNSLITPGAAASLSSSGSRTQKTHVPGWAVPPRILHFLKVFPIGVAVDDLVIVIPKLDGVSATSLIRKSDQGMTSNSKPKEIMTYCSSGMNDILPKPFTKESLLDMLEVRNKVYHDSRDV
jgi:hypothetical protein